MRFLLALLLAAPAFAQTSAPVAVPVPEVVEAEVDTIDLALVGEWTLDEVTAPGVLAAFGVDVQSMTASFSADGQAVIAMTAVQDGETMFRERVFTCTTENGEILEEDGAPVAYAILDDGSLELTDDEMVIRFVRAAP